MPGHIHRPLVPACVGTVVIGVCQIYRVLWRASQRQADILRIVAEWRNEIEWACKEAEQIASLVAYTPQLLLESAKSQGIRSIESTVQNMGRLVLGMYVGK